jgi:hypothetical protein
MKGIEMEEGDGCGIMMGSGFVKVEISNSIIDGCKATNGNGAGLHITTTTSSTVTLSGLTVKNCEG